MPADKIALKAPAKINLHLGVYDELDERRYHRVDSVMCAVGLYDEVCLEPADALSVSMDVDCGVDLERNTCWKAARLMGEAFGREPRICISVHKEIPSQAGLGGSSSDAAAVISGLCRLWGIDVRAPEVAAVARKVGADVPFFINPVPTFLRGAGDLLAETYPPLDGMPVVLVRAPEGVSTPEAYREFDRMPVPPRDPAMLCDALRRGDQLGVCACISNNLAPAAYRIAPECRRVKAWLSVRPDVISSQVTGSGSCVFGLCHTEEDAARIAAEARNAKDWWSCATTTVGTAR